MNVAALTYETYMANQSLLRTWLMQAIKHGDLQLAEVEWSIRDGERLPVVLLDEQTPIGLMVCELTQDALHVTALAGDLPKGWRRTILETVTQLAREQGKDKLQCKGRKGWCRRLKDMGATMTNDFVIIEVD
jgi:hypothetical protein